MRQLAADLMPGVDPKERAALGFLGGSPDYWKELQLDVDVIKTIVADEWEEKIDTVCSTFLGLTAACARCHDHKFDPITTHDYYALAGVIAGQPGRSTCRSSPTRKPRPCGRRRRNPGAGGADQDAEGEEARPGRPEDPTGGTGRPASSNWKRRPGTRTSPFAGLQMGTCRWCRAGRTRRGSNTRTASATTSPCTPAATRTAPGRSCRGGSSPSSRRARSRSPSRRGAAGSNSPGRS
jgi:hypothetical protein